MDQVLHGSATTTEAVRRAIQASEASVTALVRRHGISPTTVQKWRTRVTAADAPMAPKQPHSTVLTSAEEAAVVAFRRYPLLALCCRSTTASTRCSRPSRAPDAFDAPPLL